MAGRKGAGQPLIWGSHRPFSRLDCFLSSSEPWPGGPGPFCLVGLTLSYLHPHQHSSLQLPHPKLGHIPEGQIKGPQLLLSASIRPQLRRGAHPGRLPWPLHPAFPIRAFCPDAEGAIALPAPPLFSSLRKNALDAWVGTRPGGQTWADRDTQLPAECKPWSLGRASSCFSLLIGGAHWRAENSDLQLESPACGAWSSPVFSSQSGHVKGVSKDFHPATPALSEHPQTCIFPTSMLFHLFSPCA